MGSRQVRGLESGIEEFDHSSNAGNREWKSSSKVQGLESEMIEFESNSEAWNREWKFEASNRECRSSNQVRCVESEMKEFPISNSKNRNMARSPQFTIPILDLGSNYSIPDSKLELHHSRFQVSESDSNSFISDSKQRTWFELLHSRFETSNFHCRLQASEFDSNSLISDSKL